MFGAVSPRTNSAEGPDSFLEVAPEFQGPTLEWLLGFASGDQIQEVARLIVSRRWAGALVLIIEAGFDFTRCCSKVAPALAECWP
jgi:hypothetical protein